MRTLYGKILLAFLLFAVASVYGNAGKGSGVTQASMHAVNGSVNDHSSIHANHELALSVTHCVCRTSQQVSIKKITGFENVESPASFASRQNRLFSYRGSADNRRPAHLLLIYPFHYFW